MRDVASARHRPEPRLVRKLEIRARDDGFSDVILPNGRPHRVHPMVVEAHRALEEGAPFDEIVRRAAPLWNEKKAKVVSKLLRQYMLDLADLGVVEIPFEEPPLVLADRYERVKRLGRGAMGIAYLCADRKTGATIVLKRSWGWSTPIEKAELTNRREAALLATLDHPLIPRLVETFEEDGLLHIVREFAEGSPLVSQGRAIAALPSAQRLGIWRDACEAVKHLHDRGYVYLDVKPDNFVLSKLDGRARLIDLGLARECPPEGVALRSPIGSRGYAAPEVVREKRADARSDVYGLGRLLFFLATATRPRTKHAGETLRATMTEKDVDAREADLVARCAAADPAARPSSLAEVLEAL